MYKKLQEFKGGDKENATSGKEYVKIKHKIYEGELKREKRKGKGTVKS
jgi:hypothetical protein